jgi:hypothetical protein
MLLAFMYETVSAETKYEKGTLKIVVTLFLLAEDV